LSFKRRLAKNDFPVPYPELEPILLTLQRQIGYLAYQESINTSDDYGKVCTRIVQETMQWMEATNKAAIKLGEDGLRAIGLLNDDDDKDEDKDKDE